MRQSKLDKVSFILNIGIEQIIGFLLESEEIVQRANVQALASLGSIFTTACSPQHFQE